jgi:hypothetical protein
MPLAGNYDSVSTVLTLYLFSVVPAVVLIFPISAVAGLRIQGQSFLALWPVVVAAAAAAAAAESE